MDVAAPPPFAYESDELHHGRKEMRIYKVYAIEPLRVGRPHIRTLEVREKTVEFPMGSLKFVLKFAGLSSCLPPT